MKKEKKMVKEEQVEPVSSSPLAPSSQTAGTKQADPMMDIIKNIENVMFTIKLYPVAANKTSKDEAVEKLVEIHQKGNETVKQLILYMIHENLCQSAELKFNHNFEYFKAKMPNQEHSQLRMNVYRSMFNYHTSLEGLFEFVRLLGRLNGNDDAAKLLSHHFAHLSNYETEQSHMLRSVIIETLGRSESHYALAVLLEYTKYTDNERTFQRLINALILWDQKIDTLKITENDKSKLRSQLQEMITSDFAGNHYG